MGNIRARKQNLRLLYHVLKRSEKQILDALYEDLGKSPFESYATELGLVLNEIRHQLSGLRRWAGKRHAGTNLVNFPSWAYVVPEPYGRVLIIATWNYPFQLLFMPLAGALAAGNSVVLKPSEFAPATALLAERLMKESFPEELISVVRGGAETGRKLLEEKFDFIFFTGSTKVGKLVMEAASRHLTPVCLELGGKNPCIVDSTANIDIAARRICWGKFINAGQTCIAPDHLYIHESVYKEFQGRMIHYIKKFYGENPAESPDYMRIVNQAHFERMKELLGQAKIIYGGETFPEKLRINPALVTGAVENSELMKEEIFGPVLPLISYTDSREVFNKIRSLPRPMVAYLFSSDKSLIKEMSQTVKAGAVLINETVMHITNPSLPFGGAGYSGMGAYHGHYSFMTFSHDKVVMKKTTRFDVTLRYPPYVKLKLKLLKYLMM